LLHDLGKLNPFYQVLFSNEPAQHEIFRPKLEKQYLRAHAFFSSLAAYRLVQLSSLSSKTRMQILLSVCGHHSRLVQFCKTDGFRAHEQFVESLEGTFDNLVTFAGQVNKIDEFKELNWQNCLGRFKDLPLLDPYGSDGQVALDYIDFCSVFSALLQADRGSFYDWSLPEYSIKLNTNVLIRPGPLSDLRRVFQEKVLSDNDFAQSLMVLEAPTGIGKTKIFLDIIEKCSQFTKIRRVFYFSPLLALTDDFEGKLFAENKELSVGANVRKTPGASIIGQEDLEKVIVYNHTFTGSLSKKRKMTIDESMGEESVFFRTKEYFEIESFNKELIITTTQRLLMTLYSNLPSDKIKLLSFKDSLLVVDEVQTIPKFLLPNLIELLKVLAQKYNARILLVSATIPEQLKCLSLLKVPKDIGAQYLAKTTKQIELIQEFNPSEIKIKSEKVLFIANTKKKTRHIYECLSKLGNNVLYISTGISKRSRKSLIDSFKKPDPVTVVSTQVMEAGVDVSFDRIYREMAPLDNIIQAMGRLNREGNALTVPTLSVFCSGDEYRPYSELEVKISKQIISEVHSSQELYAKLPEYYKQVNSLNMRNRNLASDLESKMSRLEFDEVWDFIKSYVLPVEIGDSVLVPNRLEWDQVKNHFISKNVQSKGVLYRRFADQIAELPKSVEALGLEDNFDPQLMDMGVFLPKKDKIDEVYDSKIGLDKWVDPK
jgi:CRISPR-associated helicase Cas3